MNVRHKKLTGVVALMAVVILLAWRFLPSPEPAYNGKSLSAWAQQYGSNNWRSGGAPAAREAETAIRQMGTDAIPYLLDLIQVRDSNVKKSLRVVIPPSWHDRLHLKDFSETIRRTGADGLAALGTNAATALPKLIEVATHHPVEDGRYVAVHAISTLNATAEPAVPFLIQCLTNAYFNIRADAAWGLGYIERQPQIVVPALVQYLESARTSPHMTERMASIDSLAHFGTNAKPAAPLVLPLLTNPVPIIRMLATNALLRMEVETTVKPK